MAAKSDKIIGYLEKTKKGGIVGAITGKSIEPFDLDEEMKDENPEKYYEMKLFNEVLHLQIRTEDLLYGFKNGLRRWGDVEAVFRLPQTILASLKGDAGANSLSYPDINTFEESIEEWTEEIEDLIVEFDELERDETKLEKLEQHRSPLLEEFRQITELQKGELQDLKELIEQDEGSLREYERKYGSGR